jgi:hypothetical protein
MRYINGLSLSAMDRLVLQNMAEKKAKHAKLKTVDTDCVDAAWHELKRDKAKE